MKLSRPKPLTRGRKILEELRMQIVNSVYEPGTRMPTRAELEKKLRTTPVTVQRVFDRLEEEGFVESRGRHGTYVSVKPPHLNHFGLVFPYRSTVDRNWPQFWSALSEEALIVSRESGHRITHFYWNETHQDLETYLQLKEDVLAHRLAGLIFATNPLYLQGSPILEEKGIPRVAFMSRGLIPGVKMVHFASSFLPMALQRLAAEGRKRVAVVTLPQLTVGVAAAVAEHGMTMLPYWLQVVNTETPATARNAMHLLMAANPNNRPDALVILDDNLVPHATAGLVDAGVKVPDEVMVIAHCNFPYPTAGAVPMIRLGYDVHHALRVALTILENQRAGREVPDVTEVTATFGDELSK